MQRSALRAQREIGTSLASCQAMLGIPRRHGHFVFAVIQSGLTSLVASGIASYPLLTSGRFFGHWLLSGLAAWAVMLPIVLLAAPFIRTLADALTREG